MVWSDRYLENTFDAITDQAGVHITRYRTHQRLTIEANLEWQADFCLHLICAWEFTFVCFSLREILKVCLCYKVKWYEVNYIVQLVYVLLNNIILNNCIYILKVTSI